jgi:hypothetical protein
MKGQTRNKGIAAIFTAALVGTLFVGGIGGYLVAKAEGPGPALDASTATRASRWDHEELAALESTTRASRWDHEEQTAMDSSTPRASRWDHEER